MRSLLVAVAALGAVLAQPAAASQKPQTLWLVSHGRIEAFAQDGQNIAWFIHGSTCNTVHLQSLQYPVGYDLPSQTKHNVTCKFVWSRDRPVLLALAGVRALWSLPQQSPLALDYLLGAVVSKYDRDRAERRFVEVVHNARGVGQWLGGIAGDGGTLAYGVTTVDWDDEAGCLAGTGPCTLTKAGGGVYVVRGRQTVRVAAGPAVEVATAGGDVAYVPTGRLEENGRPRPTADLPITVVDAGSGQRIASVVPQGVPLALAMSPHVLTTLERTPLGLRLAWYDANTGHARGSIPVPKTTTPWLTASDQLIVFRVGRSIRGVSVDSHRSRLIARAAATPIGLSLEGGRLAWAENLSGLSRIRAVYVSGRG